METWYNHKIYHGFRLLSQEQLPELNATGYLFLHEKSGAQLCYIQSPDTNKVFSIAFQTPPENDCGTPHILEHSVLCGSRKYQAKDPFNELAKGSLNTFLNAMTYADKTMYPIASCNETDFRNMMDVYLDAVFYPNIYQYKGIFLQEGWRYDITENAMQATGVVFNEMKGALADAESRLASFNARSIFGETTYGFESGGEPMAILDLSYDDFLNFHKKYYHPSNAYIYLYGDMDALYCMKHLDEAYLSHFTKTEKLQKIALTKVPRPNVWLQGSYPSEGEGSEQAYFSCNFKVGHCTDVQQILAMQLIGYLLLETNASPLKNALRDAQICEEAEGYFDSSTLEMVYSIIAKKCAKENYKKFEEIIHDTLYTICQNGFEQELLSAGIKKLEFLLREEDYGSRPKGLVYLTRMMKRWLHGENPFDTLHLLHHFTELKEKIKEGYLQTFIKTYLLDNPEKTWVLFTPDNELQQKESIAMQEKIQQKLQALGEQKTSLLEQETHDLLQFQEKEDTPEILAQIPLLQLEDISKKPQEVNFSQCNQKNIPYIHVPLQNNGIAYIQLLFHAEHLKKEQIPYAGLLTELYGKLDTVDTGFKELAQKTDQIFGGLAFTNDIYIKNKNDYQSFVAMNFKTLMQDLPEAFSFAKEVFTKTKFDVIENLIKIIQTAKLQGEFYFQNRAHLTAIHRSRAAIAFGAAIKEATSGIAYYEFLKKVEQQLQQDPSVVIQALQETAHSILQQQNFTAVIGCSMDEKLEIEKLLFDFVNVFPIGQKQSALQPELSQTQEGFCIPSAVQYNVLSWDFADTDQVYHGSMQVLRTIITLEYLWNQVRVQGGAYGCGCNFQKNGGIYFYSYRDPNLKQTYQIYRTLYQKISDFTANEREMTKYILGTINNFDQPKTNAEKMDYVAAMVFTGLTNEMRQKERTEILETTQEQIQEYAGFLKQLAETNNICTIGNKTQLQEASELFAEVKNLITT